jgi:hypothetical protein
MEDIGHGQSKTMEIMEELHEMVEAVVAKRLAGIDSLIDARVVGWDRGASQSRMRSGAVIFFDCVDAACWQFRHLPPACTLQYCLLQGLVSRIATPFGAHRNEGKP